LKKVMLLAAMLAMVLAAAVPALAQSMAQYGNGDVACVQTAINAEVGKTQIAVSQYGDATNINVQAISQQCNVTPAQVSSVVANVAPAAAPSGAQYQYASPSASASPSATPSATPSASPSASASASAAAQLPPTGGASLIALGAGVLLVAGGLLARRIVR
jgi:hypothetical protein